MTGPSSPEPQEAAAGAMSSRITNVLGTVWLVFLAFPVVALLNGSFPGWQKALGMVLLLAFATVYAAGFIIGSSAAFTQGPQWTRIDPRVALSLITMGALALGVATIIGLDALGMTSFIIAASMFTLPITASWTVALTMLAVTILAPVFGNAMGEWAFMVVINFAIVVGTGTSRYFSDRAQAEMDLDRQRAVVVERERVARDVHDVLGHSLTVIALKTELAERLLDADPDRARAELREANALAREAIADVRATVGGLKVRQLGTELTQSRAALEDAGLAVTVEGEADDVDPRHRIVLAWALRETTTNILRHANARTAAVTLGPGRLVVDDDGSGLGGAPTGHGLAGLRERIEDAGGTLDLGASPLGGTRVEVKL